MQNRFSILKSIKNQILILFLFFSFQLSAQSTLVTELTGNPLNTNGWHIVRNNSLSGLVNGQEFVLTPDNTGTQSVIYYNTPFNLNQCNKWRIEFEYRIWGNGTPSYGNGDGMAFWYLDNPPQNFVGGGEIGIPSNAKGIMMIMDTFDNDTEGPNNEFQILYGQNYNTGRNPNITKFNTQDFGLNVRSNGYRPVVITWENGKVTVSINGLEIVTDFEPTIQPGVGNVGLGYFGFSASTGAASDRHSIRNVKVYMDLVEVNTKNVTLKTCDPDGDGFANFDLTSKIDEIISNPENYQINYYNNLDDLTNEENEILTPENYTNKLSFADKVYVKVKNGEDCYDIAEIDLVVNAIKLNPIATQFFCDDDFDGKILVNLKSYQNQLVDNSTDKKFSYFSDVSLTNEILESQLENFEISNFPTSVWVVVEQTFDGEICQSNPVEIKFDLLDKITINQPEINLLDAPICLEEGSSLMLDLTQKEAFYTSETSVDFNYYETKEQAILGNNDFIIDPKNYSVSTSGSVFVRLEKSGLCANIIELKYELINQLSISNSVELPTECDDDFDGFVEFNLDESIPLFTTDNSGLTFTYFLSQEDAETQTNSQNAIQSDL